MAKYFRNFSTFSTGNVTLGDLIEGADGQWAVMYSIQTASTALAGIVKDVSTSVTAPGGKALFVQANDTLWMADRRTLSTSIPISTGFAPGVSFGGGQSKEWDVLMLWRASTGPTSLDEQLGPALKCAVDNTYTGLTGSHDEYSYGPTIFQYYTAAGDFGFGTERRLNGVSGFAGASPLGNAGNTGAGYSSIANGGGWWWLRAQREESTGGNGRYRMRVWANGSTEPTSWNIFDGVPNTNLFSTASGAWAQGGGGAGVYFKPQGLPTSTSTVALASWGASDTIADPVTEAELADAGGGGGGNKSVAAILAQRQGHPIENTNW